MTLAVTPPPDNAALTPDPAIWSTPEALAKPKVPLRCTALPKSTATVPLACSKVPRLPTMSKVKLEATPVVTDKAVAL